jgi:hypothetical protein
MKQYQHYNVVFLYVLYIWKVDIPYPVPRNGNRLTKYCDVYILLYTAFQTP